MAFLQRIHWNQLRRRKRDLERYLAGAPRDPQAWVRLAEVQRALGERERAIASYRTAAKMMVEGGLLARAVATLRLARQLVRNPVALSEEIRVLEWQLEEHRLASTRVGRLAQPLRAEEVPPPSLAEEPPGPTMRVEEEPAPGCEVAVELEVEPEAEAPIDAAPTLRGQLALRLGGRAETPLEDADPGPPPLAEQTLPELLLAGARVQVGFPTRPCPRGPDATRPPRS